MKIIEYKIVESEAFTQIGVKKAFIPIRPKGFWFLLNMTVLPHQSVFFVWWRINPFQKSEE